MLQRKEKLFGIGWNKTGTTTLGLCAEVLGYKHKSLDLDLLRDMYEKKNIQRAIVEARKYNFFEDWPWPLLYKELDKNFPNSKFILTIRKDPEVWFESIRKHALRTHPREHERNHIYGVSYPQNNKDLYIEKYIEHNKNVIDYFKGRNDQLLVLCFERGDGWEEVCSFLRLEIPDHPLPHANKSKKRVRINWFLENQVRMIVERYRI